MRIVVLGRTGQVARELARLLPGDGAVFLGRDAVDLARPEAALAGFARHLDGAEAVINAAAHTAVDRAETEEAIALAVNGTTPGVLARAAAARGVPFVQISTDYVLDGSGSTPWRPDAVPAPVNAYGRTKLAGERAVAAAGGVHAILRTSWVFSAHGPNFVRTMLRLGAERPALAVVADQIGGPTPAAAIARACLTIAAALRRDPALAGVYHHAGAPDTSWADFARAILATAGIATPVRDIPTADYPTPARRPLNSRLDCSSTEAAFGLPRPDWRKALPGIIRDMEAA
ncbi:MAG: dTDP-4-dehydrorhamnose reductase [Rubellimicrobium sp.]|nr:dTDP-4-dehydrorhamnose reductase [Rubellimicrobium sp.]